jgi:ferredoxin-NADP reductase
VAITVELLEDGEVSPDLVDELRPGDRIEGSRSDRRLVRVKTERFGPTGG